MTAAGSAGTAGRDYRIPPKAGRHRAPVEPPSEPPSVPGERWRIAIAVGAAFGIAAPIIVWAATFVAPDTTARAVAAPPTVTAAALTTAGPLAMPSIGVVGTATVASPDTLSAPESPPVFAGVSVDATATTRTVTGLTAASTPPASPDQQPATAPADTPEPAPAPEPTPPAPETTATSSAPQPTETPMPTPTATETPTPTPTPTVPVEIVPETPADTAEPAA